jgi:hypothetical protein
MGKAREKIAKGARNFKLFCHEVVDDEEVLEREERQREEKEAKRGKIRKFLGKFDYLTEAVVFASKFLFYKIFCFYQLFI